MVAKPKGELIPGTLEMLILATLRREPLHGYAIAQRIHQESGSLLRAEEGSLYPALQRLLMDGWVSAAWGVSSRNRSGEPFYIDNTAHPANRRLALARSKKTEVKGFGLSLSLLGKGNNGHFAPFAWAA